MDRRLQMVLCCPLRINEDICSLETLLISGPYSGGGGRDYFGTKPTKKLLLNPKLFMRFIIGVFFVLLFIVQLFLLLSMVIERWFYNLIAVYRKV